MSSHYVPALSGDEDILEFAPRPPRDVVPRGGTHEQQRISNRTRRNQSALDAKTVEVMRAIRNDAVVSAVAIDSQTAVINHGHAVRDAQQTEDEHRNVEEVVNHQIKRHNQKVQRYHNAFATAQEAVIAESAVPPLDHRPWYVKLLEPFPEE